MSRIARLRLAAAVTAVAVAAGLPAPAGAHGATPGHDRPATPPWLVIAGGVTQPQFSAGEAIEETVFVRTAVDSDSDGARDRVRLTLFRPRETQTRGIRVPVIFEHSPYRFGTNGAPNHPVDVAALPQETLPGYGSGGRRGGPPAAATTTRVGAVAGSRAAAQDDPHPLVASWVPRGYAVVLGESIGTGGSDGCPTVGDRNETLGTRAVIDWLNGRAEGRYAAGGRATAGWSTGDVGMVGTSYDGTLANMVATTGVEGLRTIVPVSAIASWYDYYRANGLVRAPHSGASGREDNAFQGEDLDVLAIFTQGEARFARCAAVTAELTANQDRRTGDYSRYWRERDYLRRAGNVRASVFVVHGLEDYNVMPKAYASWWRQLERHRVPRKLWLHGGGHGGPYDDEEYQRTLHRWFDYWLFGVDNDVMREPRARVQRAGGGYASYRDWPVPGARPVALRLGADSATEPGTLSTRRAPGTRQSFVDRGRELDTDAALLPGPDAAHPNRLVYRSPALRGDVHLSGTPWLTLRASVDNRRAANLTAVLVDYPPAGSAEPPVMVTRGWLDPQNRGSVRAGEPLRPGEAYTFRWDLQPDDHVFPAGHRIGLVVVSTDFDYTLRPLAGTRLTVQPAASRLVLPVVRGERSLRF